MAQITAIITPTPLFLQHITGGIVINGVAKVPMPLSNIVPKYAGLEFFTN